MGTRNKPGAFDCASKALPDEPQFTLLARDEFAPDLIDLWAALRAKDYKAAERFFEHLKKLADDRGGTLPAKIIEAERCAEEMRVYKREQEELVANLTALVRGERDFSPEEKAMLSGKAETVHAWPTFTTLDSDTVAAEIARDNYRRAFPDFSRSWSDAQARAHRLRPTAAEINRNAGRTVTRSDVRTPVPGEESDDDVCFPFMTASVETRIEPCPFVLGDSQCGVRIVHPQFGDGCDKTLKCCVERFDNIARFGGNEDLRAVFKHPGLGAPYDPDLYHPGGDRFYILHADGSRTNIDPANVTFDRTTPPGSYTVKPPRGRPGAVELAAWRLKGEAWFGPWEAALVAGEGRGEWCVARRVGPREMAEEYACRCGPPSLRGKQRFATRELAETAAKELNEADAEHSRP